MRSEGAWSSNKPAGRSISKKIWTKSRLPAPKRKRAKTARVADGVVAGAADAVAATKRNRLREPLRRSSPTSRRMTTWSSAMPSRLHGLRSSRTTKERGISDSASTSRRRALPPVRAAAAAARRLAVVVSDPGATGLVENGPVESGLPENGRRGDRKTVPPARRDPVRSPMPPKNRPKQEPTWLLRSWRHATFRLGSRRSRCSSAGSASRGRVAAVGPEEGAVVTKAAVKRAAAAKVAAMRDGVRKDDETKVVVKKPGATKAAAEKDESVKAEVVKGEAVKAAVPKGAAVRNRTVVEMKKPRAK